MAIDLRDCDFFGPALPEPFVKFELERHLNRLGLLPQNAGAEGQALQREWEPLYRKLRELAFRGGEVRVRNNVLEPLVERLGYVRMVRAETVRTREGDEDAGWLMENADGSQYLRVWSVGLGTDMDAPNRRGRQYRFSPSRISQRVMLAQGERLGLLTDGEELRLLLCDPARPDSQIVIRLDRTSGWRGSRSVPDSYRLLKALASPSGVAALPKLTEDARLNQTTVTKKLRQQARSAVEGFIQELIDHPANRQNRECWTDLTVTSRELWREGLILVYRLLFIFKLESSADPARAFSFAATSLWRNSYSPNIALATYVRKVLDDGVDTGSFLEESLRAVFRIFAEGLSSSELRVSPLGGALFGPETTPLINKLAWGEQAVAKILDRLLWTPGDGRTERERVHYGTLDVEDLGRVYETLLELEPGITTEPMCRLRRAKLEVVVPVTQGAPYRANAATEESDDEEEAEENEEETSRQVKIKTQWVEDIPVDRFYLRVGLGRKASGSYYTPHPFVRFLVQETLGPQVQGRSPADDPQPGEILKLKVLDPAMGSGHFLVEACRFLGDALYEACRLCDERALEAEEYAEAANGSEREAQLHRAAELRKRVEELPDPNDELVAYLPSRVPEGLESGHSQRKAEAICRRLVAVHCLYGVDKNELAVELAKLSLWLESYAEGLPLTFLDHRLICGDSLIGPFFEHLLTYPRSRERLQGLFAEGLVERLQEKLSEALAYVRDLEASVGKDIADLELKRLSKANLDDALAPFKLLATAWSGGVMLGERASDNDYEALVQVIAEGGHVQELLSSRPRLSEMLDIGTYGVSFDICFPEVFYNEGVTHVRSGFHAVQGNPPWDAIQFKSKEFLAGFDLAIMDVKSARQRQEIEDRILSHEHAAKLFKLAAESFERAKRANDALYRYQKVIIEGDLAGRQLDAFRVFMERNAQLVAKNGITGVVVPSAFHANAGAAGIRQLYLEKMALTSCFSFENRNKLFEIDSRFKFATVVARNDLVGTIDFDCAFYLRDVDWLFKEKEPLKYSLKMVKATGGSHLTFIELRTLSDANVANRLSDNEKTLGKVFHESNIVLRREIDPNDEEEWIVKSLASSDAAFFPIYEGKNFHRYDDKWEGGATAWVNIEKHPFPPKSWSYYRLTFRRIARSNDEFTSIWTVLPPGSVGADSNPIEQQPYNRPNSTVLYLEALCNSFSFDFYLRLRVSANVSPFIINGCPVPDLPNTIKQFLAHAALRLTCRNDKFSPLFTEQLGDVWREPNSQRGWPVFNESVSALKVLSTIDVLVAFAYRLSREQYVHILSTFSHRSYPQLPVFCLAAFDELTEIGLEAFCRKYDPYWDIPLNNNLPQPVIELPIPGEQQPTGSRGPVANRSGQYALFEESPGPLFDAATKPDRE